MTEKSTVKKHTVNLYERKRAELDGINSILGFDEHYLSLDTEFGKLIIEGEGLKVENLLYDSGKISLSGEICALYYEKKKEKRSRSLIK